MENKVNSVSLAVVVLLAATMLLATSAAAQPGKIDKPGRKDKEKGSYLKPTVTAEQAMSAVKAALPKLTVGKSFVKTGRRGEKKLEVTLVLDGKIVSRVRLNPATGEILCKGEETLVYEVSASQEQAVKIVQRAIPKLEVGSVTLGKQGEWKVDLTHKKAVVADMSVHGGDGSILPDLKASQDASPGFTPGPPVPPSPGAYPPPPPPPPPDFTPGPPVPPSPGAYPPPPRPL